MGVENVGEKYRCNVCSNEVLEHRTFSGLPEDGSHVASFSPKTLP